MCFEHPPDAPTPRTWRPQGVHNSDGSNVHIMGFEEFLGIESKKMALAAEDPHQESSRAMTTGQFRVCNY
jgi:hypothetical protein